MSTFGLHVIEQGVELAEAIAGDRLSAGRPLLPVDGQAEAWAAEAAPARTGPLVLVNPGAGWGAKRWPAERYAEVARRLAHEGCQIVVNAGPGELDLARQIAAASGGLVLDCSVAELIALTRRVDLLIAGDTGPLHLACALGKPVVGIFGPTDPVRNGPFGVPFEVLRSSLSRRDHKRRPDPEAGLLTIEPMAVVDAARRLLYPERDPR